MQNEKEDKPKNHLSFNKNTIEPVRSRKEDKPNTKAATSPMTLPTSPTSPKLITTLDDEECKRNHNQTDGEVILNRWNDLAYQASLGTDDRYINCDKLFPTDDEAPTSTANRDELLQVTTTTTTKGTNTTTTTTATNTTSNNNGSDAMLSISATSSSQSNTEKITRPQPPEDMTDEKKKEGKKEKRKKDKTQRKNKGKEI